MVEEFGNTFSIEVECYVDEVENLLSKEAEINIFRIMQESSNNIGKHSGATHATISMKKAGSTVVLSIEDDGKGIDVSRKESGSPGRSGFGLSGIQERTKLLGGKFTLQSHPGKGTRITVVLPISSAND